MVAVTAEKNVATVDRFRRLAAPCSCANRMVGTPTGMGWLWCRRENRKGPRHTDFDEYREGISDRFYVFTNFRYKIMQISLNRWIPKLACIDMNFF